MVSNLVFSVSSYILVLRFMIDRSGSESSRRSDPISQSSICTFNLQVRRWVVFADVSGFELAGVSHPLSVLANLEAALVFATWASIFVILIEIALNLQFQWGLLITSKALMEQCSNSTPKNNFRMALG